ncbi:hypothetical protein FLGE108171_15925 [Flavobacterium gelidilacus]|uniref:hypothetical protein n=1 Tax=Flavobacterium gelidilacus TaxID=206041 RepID=UPI00041EF619|nr:hypothetical protein [Flavobacterium gelidilacus]
MEETTKSISEGEAKDLILEYALENRERAISSQEIKKELFPHFDIDEIELLFKKIQNSVDEIATIRISTYGCIITATGITKIYLEQGGFTKTEKDTLELNRKETEKGLIEFEKSIIDLRLKKWQLKTFWWIFGIAIIGSSLSVYNFINNLMPSKNEVKQEMQIEKMESELSKMHTLFLDQKKVDSLRNSNSEKGI